MRETPDFIANEGQKTPLSHKTPLSQKETDVRQTVSSVEDMEGLQVNMVRLQMDMIGLQMELQAMYQQLAETNGILENKK